MHRSSFQCGILADQPDADLSAVSHVLQGQMSESSVPVRYLYTPCSGAAAAAPQEGAKADTLVYRRCLAIVLVPGNLSVPSSCLPVGSGKLGSALTNVQQSPCSFYVRLRRPRVGACIADAYVKDLARNAS